MLDNAGGPSGVQVKNPFVIYAKMERNKKQKTSFRADFFFSTSNTSRLPSSHWAQEQNKPLLKAGDRSLSDWFSKGLYSDVHKSLNSNKHDK